jgi:hypothetical protein
MTKEGMVAAEPVMSGELFPPGEPVAVPLEVDGPEAVPAPPGPGSDEYFVALVTRLLSGGLPWSERYRRTEADIRLGQEPALAYKAITEGRAVRQALMKAEVVIESLIRALSREAILLGDLRSAGKADPLPVALGQGLVTYPMVVGRMGSLFGEAVEKWREVGRKFREEYLSVACDGGDWREYWRYYLLSAAKILPRESKFYHCNSYDPRDYGCYDHRLFEAASDNFEKVYDDSEKDYYPF